MPFKGDENMLVDAKDRAALDADEGDDQLLMGFGDSSQTGNTAGGNTNAPADNGGLLDLDMMLGGPTDSGAQNNNMGGMQNDLMGLFDAPP